jgi:hypothetical protein
VVDPDVPSLIVWELDSGGQYVERRRLEGAQTWSATAPFDVTLSPDALIT